MIIHYYCTLIHLLIQFFALRPANPLYSESPTSPLPRKTARRRLEHAMLDCEHAVLWHPQPTEQDRLPMLADAPVESPPAPPDPRCPGCPPCRAASPDSHPGRDAPR